MLFLFILGLWTLEFYQVSEATLEEFKSWHYRSVDFEELNQPFPELIELYPGMTRATQILPTKTRQFLVERFKTYDLSEQEWAQRWQQIESLILLDHQGVLGALRSMEKLGQELFERMSLEEGLLVEHLPPLQEAEKSRFFLMPDDLREETYKEKIKNFLSEKDDRFDTVLEIMKKEDLAPAVTETQQRELGFLLLKFYDQFKNRGDWPEIRDSFLVTLAGQRREFRQRMGFTMPDPEKIYATLQAMKEELSRP